MEAIELNNENINSKSAVSSGKSVGVAYLLWLFLGLAGMHRFYLGLVGSGVVMLVLLLCAFIPFFGLFVAIPLGLWWLVDALLIPGLASGSRTKP